MTSPGDHSSEPPEEGDAPAEGRTSRVGGSGASAALCAIARPVRLVVTAIAIVLALAFGIPWLIDLVW